MKSYTKMFLKWSFVLKDGNISFKFKLVSFYNVTDEKGLVEPLGNLIQDIK